MWKPTFFVIAIISLWCNYIWMDWELQLPFCRITKPTCFTVLLEHKALQAWLTIRKPYTPLSDVLITLGEGNPGNHSGLSLHCVVADWCCFSFSSIKCWHYAKVEIKSKTWGEVIDRLAIALCGIKPLTACGAPLCGSPVTVTYCPTISCLWVLCVHVFISGIWLCVNCTMEWTE